MLVLFLIRDRFRIGKTRSRKKLGLFSLQLCIPFFTETAFAKERQDPERMVGTCIFVIFKGFWTRSRNNNNHCAKKMLVGTAFTQERQGPGKYTEQILRFFSLQLFYFFDRDRFHEGKTRSRKVYCK